MVKKIVLLLSLLTAPAIADDWVIQTVTDDFDDSTSSYMYLGSTFDTDYPIPSIFGMNCLKGEVVLTLGTSHANQAETIEIRFDSNPKKTFKKSKDFIFIGSDPDTYLFKNSLVEDFKKAHTIRVRYDFSDQKSLFVSEKFNQNFSKFKSTCK